MILEKLNIMLWRKTLCGRFAGSEFIVDSMVCYRKHSAAICYHSTHRPHCRKAAMVIVGGGRALLVSPDVIVTPCNLIRLVLS